MNNPTNRTGVILFIFFSIGVIFFFRLFYIQIWDSSYKESAEGNIIRKQIIYPSRGLIKDRTGDILVCNEPIYDLMVIPKQVKMKDTLSFCKIMDITKEDYITRLISAKKYSKYKPSVFDNQLSNEIFGNIQDKLINFPGFFVQARTVRSYPARIAANALGYIGEISKKKLSERSSEYIMGDYIGINGLEEQYEKVLRGKRGVRYRMVDVKGVEMGLFKQGAFDTLSVSGLDLTTTLDKSIQQYGESLMLNKVGSIVAIEPSTGEILCFISSPTYDPSLLRGKKFSLNYEILVKDSLKPLFNRPLMAQYPPGSVFKILNNLVSQQEKVVFNSSTYPCDGSYTVGTLNVGCHSHPSPCNLLQSLQYSCNSYYCAIFRDILDQKKYKQTQDIYAKWRNRVMSFGLGSVLRIDLSNEKPGYIPTIGYYNKYFGENRWKSTTILSLAIGQGEILCTPLQLANLATIIANRGSYFVPHLVKKIGGQGIIVPRYLTRKKTQIDSSYFSVVVEGMNLAVDAGTATMAKVNNLPICGKTGTAQNPHGKDHSIFIGFAPKEKPRIAIAVVVENSGFGGSWAAPIASLIMEKYLTDSLSKPWLEKYIMDADFINKKK